MGNSGVGRKTQDGTVEQAREGALPAASVPQWDMQAGAGHISWSLLLALLS